MEASINCWYTDTLGVGVAISVGGSPIGPSPGWAALRASTTRVDPPPAQESPVPGLQRALQPKKRKGRGSHQQKIFRAPDPHPSPSRVAGGVQRRARRSKLRQILFYIETQIFFALEKQPPSPTPSLCNHVSIVSLNSSIRAKHFSIVSPNSSIRANHFF